MKKVVLCNLLLDTFADVCFRCWDQSYDEEDESTEEAEDDDGSPHVAAVAVVA